MIAGIHCPYCGKKAKEVTGHDLYPRRKDLWDKKFWQCRPCGAYVGCHPGTNLPLGRLANAELRRAKMQAHAAFDPIWQNKKMPRSKAYRWLAKQLDIPDTKCHIGLFSEEQCARAVTVCVKFANQGGAGNG